MQVSHNLIPEYFHHKPISHHASFSLPFHPRQPLVYVLFLWNYLFCTIRTNRIIHCAAFLWLVSFSWYDAFKAHLCCSMYKKKSMHLYFWVVFHCIDTAHFVYPFTCWWTFGVFPALLAVVNKGTSYKYLFTGICENMCLLLLGKYLGEEYLGHMIGRGLPV